MGGGGRSQKYGEHNQSRDVFGRHTRGRRGVDSSHSSETETVISLARGRPPLCHFVIRRKDESPVEGGGKVGNTSSVARSEDKVRRTIYVSREKKLTLEILKRVRKETSVGVRSPRWSRLARRESQSEKKRVCVRERERESEWENRHNFSARSSRWTSRIFLSLFKGLSTVFSSGGRTRDEFYLLGADSPSFISPSELQRQRWRERVSHLVTGVSKLPTRNCG